MRIVLKIGSALISKESKIDYPWLTLKISEIAKLHNEDNEIILVTSGAVAAGMEIRNLKVRPKDVLKLQMLSGQGQVKLIKFYQDEFLKYDINISQILLTRYNFSTDKELATITKIVDAYLKDKVIPVINENDMINKEGFVSDKDKIFSDNDILAAHVGKNLNADLVVLMTDVDGLYYENPKTNEKAKILLNVKDINSDIFNMASKETNSVGLGGMFSKVTAAKILKDNNINTIVGNGRYSIIELLNGKVPRTFFH